MSNPPTLKSLNPADDTIVGEVIITPTDMIPDLVKRARAAQSTWSRLSLSERRDILVPVGQRIAAMARETGILLSREMGKPLPEAMGEVRHCGQTFVGELDELVDALRPENHVDKHTQSKIFFDPYGVCAVITPWNFPFAMPHWLVCPALMAGNAVILKPSEETPLVGQAYADALNTVLPDGLLQVVHGADEQGRALVESDVDLIAFTGSKAVGQSILSQASHDLKRVILELGGKDPLIIMDDANVSAAARFAARNSFRNAGQVCVSTERIYVSDKLADDFVDALVDQANQLRVGPGMDERTQVGPMINRTQRDHVVAQVNDALAKGASLLTGGDTTQVGSFLSPIVLDHVTHEMEIARDETFGPAAVVIRVRDVDEAVRLANDSELGLGAIVYGTDTKSAERIGRRLDAGMIGINRSVGGASGTPWVGAKQSGYGFHKSIAGHRQFAQLRVLSKRADNG
ncbi:MAG: aldehyde dehydrogenase family protein [Myxococcota bacterium]|nr:aldehyde dehydrogenase family protein [Myxococcota bacterium]